MNSAAVHSGVRIPGGVSRLSGADSAGCSGSSGSSDSGGSLPMAAKP